MRHARSLAAGLGFVLLMLCRPPVAVAQDAPELPADDQCITCHVDFGAVPEDFSEHDVHLQEGLSCAGCHGGDPTVDDMDAAKASETGYVGVPEKQDLPAFCGKCHSDPAFMRDYQPRIHTDQVEQYYVSMHGQQLRAGDDRVADCASCHTAHGILPAEDGRSSVHPLNVPATCERCHGDEDYMAPYPLPTDQYSTYVESVHGRKLLEDQDLGAPACNDCHGNHGALPPEVASVSQVCGTCHVNNMSYFEQSEMAEPFAELELHACGECHGYHGVGPTFDAMVGVGAASTCTDCHSEGEGAYDVAEDMYADLTDLVAAHHAGQTLKQTVVRIGMDDVEIEYLLSAAHQDLIQARTLVHTFDSSQVAAKAAAGLGQARAAIDLALAQIREHRTRRLGFGLATIFITLLAVGLFLKIRQLDEPPATPV